MDYNMRKIIQVSVSGVSNTIQTQCGVWVIALCDDGTVWQTDEASPTWKLLPEVPQFIVPQAPPEHRR
jgi:hypothetical protein